MNLTDSFKLEEFTSSQTAARHGIDLTPPPEVEANLKRLCILLLQPIRDAMGPIIITSGYRNEALNRMIGGARHSAHLTGRAADIRAIGVTPYGLCQSITTLKIPFDKCILEFNSWVHIQIAEGENMPRKQFLTARRIGGSTLYQEGLMA